MVEARLFVGNVPYSVSEQELRDLLSRVGNITSMLMPADRPGRPRGFALVDVASEADAREIVREFNGYILDGRRLRVERAMERAERPPYEAKYRVRMGAKGLEYVYLGNVPGPEWENTLCPGCSLPLLERDALSLRANRTRAGACPRCGRGIAGVGLDWRETEMIAEEAESIAGAGR